MNLQKLHELWRLVFIADHYWDFMSIARRLYAFKNIGMYTVHTAKTLKPPVENVVHIPEKILSERLPGIAADERRFRPNWDFTRDGLAVSAQLQCGCLVFPSPRCDFKCLQQQSVKIKKV